MIYFDHNASTPCDERVLDAMLPYMTKLYGNPSSLHRLGRIARSAIDTAREQLAALIDAQPGQIIFTSGGTEANALALAHAGASLFISDIEHPSVFENARHATSRLRMLEPDRHGRVQPETLNPSDLQPGDLISLMLANNETGAIQPVTELAEHIAGRGAILHTDAVQALGKIPLSFRKLGVQLMSLSSHKIYGPKGCGALVRAENLKLHAMQYGGDQEHGLRAGTENVAAIVGFGKAAELAKNEFEQRAGKMRTLRHRLEQRLHEIGGLVIFAETAPRLPNTVQFAAPGINGEMLLMQFDRHNIAVSSGSACSAESGEISPVLAAMSVDASLARAAIRISLGKDNTETEIDQFVGVLKTLLSNH